MFTITHQAAPPNEQTSDGRKQESNDEESRQNGLRRQYWLPCFQTLLFEGGICGFLVNSMVSFEIRSVSDWQVSSNHPFVSVGRMQSLGLRCRYPPAFCFAGR